MTCGSTSRLLLALWLCGLATAGASADSGGDVSRLLQSLDLPPPGPIGFVEQRMSALFTEPIEAHGEISLGPDGSIEKRVTAPTQERVRISADAVTVERSGTSRTAELAGDARWKAFHAGITGLLNRNAAALEQAFEISLDESPQGWRLELRPRSGGGRMIITRISAYGEGSNLRRLRIEQGDTDWQEMTFLRDGR